MAAELSGVHEHASHLTGIEPDRERDAATLGDDATRRER
jgi:hypothetical protein